VLDDPNSVPFTGQNCKGLKVREKRVSIALFLLDF